MTYEIDFFIDDDSGCVEASVTAETVPAVGDRVELPKEHTTRPVVGRVWRYNPNRNANTHINYVRVDVILGGLAMTASEFQAYEYGESLGIAAVTDILDGKDTGAGASNEPWNTVRRRLLALVQNQPAWVPVTERLPEPRQPVVLVNVNRWENCSFDRNIHQAGYLDDWTGRPHWAVYGERAQMLTAYTHWMALLPTPKEEEAGDA